MKIDWHKTKGLLQKLQQPLVNVRLFGLAMWLRDDNHRSGGSRTWYGTRRRMWRRTRRRMWRRTRRRRATDNGRIAVAVVVMVVVMAADSGEGQGSDNQQGEDFTHGHVSFCYDGKITGGFAFVFFRCL